LPWVSDEEKNRINRRDHKVSFGIAELVFDDPLAITLPDPYQGEERWRTIGSPSRSSGVVLFVVHTWREADEARRRGWPHYQRPKSYEA
jgi:uncharacterized protein